MRLVTTNPSSASLVVPYEAVPALGSCWRWLGGNAAKRRLQSASGSFAVHAKRLAIGLMVGVVAALSGCALVPPEPLVQGPLTAEPAARLPQVALPNGSIYQPAAYGSYPLFEDRRPRNVGDIVTVVLNERVNAAK